jgi:hypothetical protein
MDASDQRRISAPVDLAAYEAGDAEAMNRNSLGESEYHIEQPQPPAQSGYSNNQIVASPPANGEPWQPLQLCHSHATCPAVSAAKAEEKGACKLCALM